MFATKATLKEAIEFAYAMIQTLEGAERIVAYTSLHVALNTMAKAIMDNDKTDLRNTAWNKWQAERATNPDYSTELLELVIKELHKDTPCEAYIREKMDTILNMTKHH
jgi:hypothetical protein